MVTKTISNLDNSCYVQCVCQSSLDSLLQTYHLKTAPAPPKYSRVFYLFSILPPRPPHQTKHEQDPFAREISNAKRVAYIPEVDPQALPRRRKEWSPTNALLVGNWMISASVPSERTFCDVV